MGSGGVTNLVAKLTLNTKEWGTNIASASQDLKRIQQSVANASDFISNLGGSLVSGATKFAGFAGAGLAAKEGLEKFMRAGQTTSDWMDRNMASWSGLFDNFFRSLNNGDVSGFILNMGAIKSAIEDAVIAADAFSDALASMDVLSLKYDLKQRELLEKLKRNKDNPELVKQIQAELKKLEEDRKNMLTGVVAQIQSSFDALLNSTMTQPMSTGIRGLGRFSLQRIMQLNPTTLNEFLKIMEAETLGVFNVALEEAKQLAKGTVGTRQTYQYDIHGNRIMGYEKYDKKVLSDQEISSYMSKWGFSIADILYYNELVDTTRNELKKSASQLYNLKRSGYEFNERNTEVFNIGASGGAGGAGSSAVNYLQGSLGWYDQQISEKRKELLATTDKAVIADITRVIEQLENARKRLRIEALFGAEPTATALGATFKPINGVTKIDPYKLKPVKIFEPEQKNVIEDVRVGLGGVADMLGIIAGATDDGASAWLNYASKVINAISSMLPALQALGIGNATSQSAAAGPFGWVQIPVAVAAVASAFMSAPKFANGGIVPGTSYSGDKVMSYLNSGEMVLNAGQQARLFAMLNGASSAGGGAVEFEIRGDKLVGVLNNYNRRRAKVV